MNAPLVVIMMPLMPYGAFTSKVSLLFMFLAVLFCWICLPKITDNHSNIKHLKLKLSKKSTQTKSSKISTT